MLPGESGWKQDEMPAGSAAFPAGSRTITAGTSALGRFPARWEQAELELCTAAKPAAAQSSRDVRVEMQQGHLSSQGNSLLRFPGMCQKEIRF